MMDHGAAKAATGGCTQGCIESAAREESEAAERQSVCVLPTSQARPSRLAFVDGRSRRADLGVVAPHQPPPVQAAQGVHTSKHATLSKIPGDV